MTFQLYIHEKVSSVLFGRSMANLKEVWKRGKNSAKTKCCFKNLRKIVLGSHRRTYVLCQSYKAFRWMVWVFSFDCSHPFPNPLLKLRVVRLDIFSKPLCSESVDFPCVIAITLLLSLFLFSFSWKLLLHCRSDWMYDTGEYLTFMLLFPFWELQY